MTRCLFAILIFCATNVWGGVLFSDDFEGYLSGSNLFGQGNWVGDPNFPNQNDELIVDDCPMLDFDGDPLTSNLCADGRVDPGTGEFGIVVQPIPAPSPGDIYTLSFDAFAYTGAGQLRTHDVVVGFAINGVSGDTKSVHWQANGFPSGHWTFVVDHITGSNADNTVVQGGYGMPVRFEIVFDANDMVLFGRYDFGNGFIDTPSTTLSPADISDFDGISILQDYRSPASFLGAEFDNILLVNLPTCKGLSATIEGTAGNDTIVGTAGDDVIVGLDGNDTIDALGGNDTVCGGKGNDTLSGGSGNDNLRGGNGNDTLKGNNGADILRGRKGNDTLIGGNGDDVLKGDGDNDTCIGGDGVDTDQECEVIISTEGSVG